MDDFLSRLNQRPSDDWINGLHKLIPLDDMQRLLGQPVMNLDGLDNKYRRKHTRRQFRSRFGPDSPAVVHYLFKRGHNARLNEFISQLPTAKTESLTFMTPPSTPTSLSPTPVSISFFTPCQGEPNLHCPLPGMVLSSEDLESPNNKNILPSPQPTVASLASSVSLSPPEARDSRGSTADQLSISNFEGGAGLEVKATLSKISEADWGHRRSDNYMSYAYLEKSLNDLKNYVFVGRVHDEICSLFVYRFTGRDAEDATIVLLWTKDTWRRKGFCTKIMHEGIGFLDNKCLMMAGTSITPTSRAVFRSQRWNGIDDSMLSVLLQNLRKTLEKKRFQKGTGDGREWEEKIPRSVLECYRAQCSSRCPRQDFNDGSATTDAPQKRTQVLNRNGFQGTPIARKTLLQQLSATMDRWGTSHQNESPSKRPREDGSGKERSKASSKKSRVISNVDAIASSSHFKATFNPPRTVSRVEGQVFEEDLLAGKLQERVLDLETQVGILLDRVETLEEIISAA